MFHSHRKQASDTSDSTRKLDKGVIQNGRDVPSRYASNNNGTSRGGNKRRLKTSVICLIAFAVIMAHVFVYSWTRVYRSKTGNTLRDQQIGNEYARLIQYPWLTYVWRKAVSMWKDFITSKHCLEETVRESILDGKNGFQSWKDECREGIRTGKWPIAKDANSVTFCDKVTDVAKNLRIFSIPKPRKIWWRDLFLNLLPYMENSHAVEYVLYQQFKSSIFQAPSINVANAFLIPAQPYLDGIAHITYVDGARYALQDRMHSIMLTSQWRESGGCEFFAPSMWDQGRGMFWHADNRGEGLMENVTIITARTEHSTGSPLSTKFNIDKDISAVAIYENHVAEIACRNAKEVNIIRNQERDIKNEDRKHSLKIPRDGLLFFSGSVHKTQRLRNSILSYYGENPEDGVMVTSQPFNGDEYTKKMLEHKYCLQVQGYANLSPRVSEYSLLGCIPVVVVASNSSLTLNPLHRIIDWKRIALEIGEHDIPNLTNILREDINNGTYWRRFQSALSIRKMLTYHSSPTVGDATWMTAYELIERLQSCKKRNNLQQ